MVNMLGAVPPTGLIADGCIAVPYLSYSVMANEYA